MSDPKINYNFSVRYNRDHVEEYTPTEYAVLVDNILVESKRAYPFSIDGKDYYVLAHAAKCAENVSGLFCEIGLRGGGGMKFIFDEVVKSGRQRTCISIDPYGGIPYEGMDNEVLEESEFTNELMMDTLRLIYDYVRKYPQINFLFFPLEDTEFFTRYSDGVPVYSTIKQVVNQYALVHFDGPHTTEAVMIATKFFEPRTVEGAVFVYDDVEFFYDHDKVEQYLLERGWSKMKKTKVKASYIKRDLKEFIE